MCGITGKIYFTGEKRVDEVTIQAMNAKIAHRGPDDSGVYTNKKGNVGLGHQRLSIIDLSPAGHQPMSNADESVWIVFNGEIYNFQELRDDLYTRGYSFRSKTDTEVIIALWEEYGEQCLQHLRGMFAFALWDERKQKLFLARDRVGKKPLKYFIGDDFLVFGSELKAFIDDPDVPHAVDYEAIHHYLSFQYVPHPMTGFVGVKKLAPAHYITIDLSKTTPSISQPTRYWQLDYTKKLTLSEPEWCERILSMLDECVRIRMIADVPLGAFLSGGIDSSAVVALMARHSRTPVKTFSIDFDAASHSEIEHARRIAKRFGTDHHEFRVEPNAIEILPTLVRHYEEPYADSSAIPTYTVAKMTRDHVTVALNGDGGDENFAGYGRYNVHQFARRYQMIPKPLRDIAVLGACACASIFPTTFFDRCVRFGKSMNKHYERSYLEYICFFTTEQKHKLFTEDMHARIHSCKDSDRIIEEKFQFSRATHSLDRVLAADIESYLPDDLLVKVDIATMAVGLEGRSPFLDHRLMELAAQIPARLKIKGTEKKYILKKAVESLLPYENIYRKKMGFGVPIEHWFRGPLKDYVHDTLLSERALQRGLFRKEAIEELLSVHQSTRVNYANHLWALLTLETWMQTFFD